MSFWGLVFLSLSWTLAVATGLEYLVFCIPIYMAYLRVLSKPFVLKCIHLHPNVLLILSDNSSNLIGMSLLAIIRIFWVT